MQKVAGVPSSNNDVYRSCRKKGNQCISETTFNNTSPFRPSRRPLQEISTNSKQIFSHCWLSDGSVFFAGAKRRAGKAHVEMSSEEFRKVFTQSVKPDPLSSMKLNQNYNRNLNKNLEGNLVPKTSEENKYLVKKVSNDISKSNLSAFSSFIMPCYDEGGNNKGRRSTAEFPWCRKDSNII
eukprot:GHVP01013571.1.p2 GENE.GHVP01013571.1~~GHVP01013571.1.p2  ORF type:complete len:181 (-),score=38.59 GHVP01013571.1:727-1269(-)